MGARGYVLLHAVDSEPQQAVQALPGKPGVVMADLL